MKRRSSMLFILTFMLIGVFILLYPFVQRYDDYLILLMIGMAFVVLLAYPSHKLSLRGCDLLWIAFALWLFCTITYSTYKLDSLKISIVLGGFIFISWVISQHRYGATLFEIYILVGSGILALSTILQLLFPMPFSSLMKHLLNVAQFDRFQSLTTHHLYSGLTGETALTAVLVSPLIAFAFCRLLSGCKNKPLYFALLAIACIALFVTGKRALLIAHVGAIVMVVAAYYLIRQKGASKFVLSITPMVLLVSVAIATIPVLQATIVRMAAGSDSRIAIYSAVWEHYVGQPFLGYGLGSVVPYLFNHPAVTVSTAHNIYLQLLHDTGVIGLLLFLSAALASLLTSLHDLRSIIRNTQRTDQHIALALSSLYFQVIFLIYGLTGNPLFDYPISLLYFISISIGRSTHRLITSPTVPPIRMHVARGYSTEEGAS